MIYYNLPRRCILIGIVIFHVRLNTAFCETESESKTADIGADNVINNTSHVEMEGYITHLQKYKHIFAEYRATQLEAVKSITSFGNDKQRYELINVMLKQLFKTLESAQSNLTLWGFLPGDSFPENETVRESLSKVLENTAMFGDMVLRMPDIVHDLYDRQREWQILLAWSYGFSIQSGVFDGPNEQLLNLMAQEVGIIPTDPNYVNPFKASNQKKKSGEETLKKSTKKKEKKKIKRGPRLSHSEL